MLDMLIGPSYDNGVTFTVNPTDLTLEADYNFYLGVMAEGNPIQFYSSPLKLVVGCTPSVPFSYDLTKFVSEIAMDQGTSGVDVYKFDPPILQLSYCPIQTYQIANLMVNNAASSIGATICTN